MNPSANTANKLSATHESRRVPENLAKFINAVCHCALGRSAIVEEMWELADVLGRSADRRSAVQSVLMMEEALVRLAEPWFWKLMSRNFEPREMGICGERAVRDAVRCGHFASDRIGSIHRTGDAARHRRRR